MASFFKQYENTSELDETTTAGTDINIDKNVKNNSNSNSDNKNIKDNKINNGEFIEGSFIDGSYIDQDEKEIYAAINRQQLELQKKKQKEELELQKKIAAAELKRQKEQQRDGQKKWVTKACFVVCILLGTIFFHIASFGCKTFKLDEPYYSYDKLGYWGVDYYQQGCSPLLSDFRGLNGPWKVGGILGIVGAVMIWGILIALIVVLCFKYPKPKSFFRIIGICMGVVSLFSFLLLIGVSVDSISLSSGGALAILSGFVWAGSTALILLCSKEFEKPLTTGTNPDVGANPSHDHKKIDTAEKVDLEA